MSIHAIVSGLGGTHDNTVAELFLLESGLSESEISVREESVLDSFAYAQSVGASIIIRSTSGIGIYLDIAHENYPSILLVMPYGNNIYADYYSPFGIRDLTDIVATGAAIEGAESNQTAYGGGLEFWDNENAGNPASAEASYANAVVAGKLYKIKQQTNCGWEDVRNAARQSASNNGIWNRYTGFGKINADAAIDLLTEEVIAMLSAPTGLAYTISGPNATLTWSTVSLATGCTVQRSLDNGGTWSAVGTTSAATITDELEQANFGYKYRVKATAPDYVDSDWTELYVGRFYGAGSMNMIPTAAL